MPVPVPVVLTILDGWGIAEPSPTNAVSVAATPNMDRLSGSYPMTTLTAQTAWSACPRGRWATPRSAT
jgi:2,3-bisphosphoglycerate-independent phosphoglycerate mutase